jgi:pyrroloquinoline quinone (PQQ) biosynthesis protein C
MNYQQFAETFIERSKNHHLWNHPYFLTISQSPDLFMLQAWAIQAGMIDGLFADLLRKLIANPIMPKCAEPSLQENLKDELGHGDPQAEHFQLFQGVLAALDVSPEQYHNSKPLAGTQAILQGLMNAAQGNDPIRALALMASEELICPQEFPLLVASIKTLGIHNQTIWLPYFDVHCEVDVRHSTELIEHVYATTSGDDHEIKRALACQVEDLNWNYLFYDSLLLQLYS